VTRNDLAPPTEVVREANDPAVDTTLILRLASTVEQLTAALTAADVELRCYTPKQAAAILGKTENWVVENIQAGSIPFTRVGKSPRLTAAHIRWIQAQGEQLPNKYAKPIAA
jgi:excisionase family DNA binding protein